MFWSCNNNNVYIEIMLLNLNDGANLVGRWSTGSEPSPFLPLKGRLRPAALVQLLLRCRFQLGEHYGEDHSARLLQLRRPRRMEFFRSTD